MSGTQYIDNTISSYFSKYYLLYPDINDTYYVFNSLYFLYNIFFYTFFFRASISITMIASIILRGRCSDVDK